MNERVLAKKKTSATPPQATQASSPLLHQRPLTDELSESLGSNSNISKELGGIQPKTIRRSLNWQNITVEAPNRSEGRSLPSGIQRQQKEPGAVIEERVSADTAQKSALELSNSTISTDDPAQKPSIARAPLNRRNIPIEAPASSSAPPETKPPETKPPETEPPNFRAEAEAETKSLANNATKTKKALQRFGMSNDAVSKACQDTFTNEFVSQRESGYDIKTARTRARKLADSEGVKVATSRAIDAARQRAETDLQSGNAFKQDPNTEAVRNKYDQGTQGGNAKSLSPSFAGRTVAEIIDILDTDVTSGRCTKSTSDLQMPNGQPPKPQIGYQYPDGTLVRVKPNGDAFLNDPMYSVEVTNNTSAPVTGQDDIAFKVGTDGKAVPKGPNDVNNPYNKSTNSEQHQAYLEEVIKAGHLTAQPNPPSTNPPPTSP